MASPPTGILFYEGRAKPLSTTGTIQPGSYYLFFLTGTLTPTNVYADGGLSIPLSQTPGTGGTTAASDGRLVPIYMDSNITYRYQLYNASNVLLEDVDPYVPFLVPTSTQIGTVLYPKSTAETAAAVTVVQPWYPPGVVDRYQANTVPGFTVMNAGFTAALAQQQATSGDPVTLLAKNYLITQSAVKTQSNQKPLVVKGVPLVSCIINTCPANTPTIQLIDQFTFDISGIIFVGRAGFANLGLDITSAQFGQRSGVGKVHDCVFLTNGTGIHLAGCNTIDIKNIKYWPNGFGAYPGLPTNDGPNSRPTAITGDYNGIAGWNSGEVNAIYIQDLEVGDVNGSGATPPGVGVLIDGSLNGSSTAPLAGHASTDWTIDGYDSGGAPTALYCRFVQFCTFKNFYCTDIKVDNDSTGITFESMFANNFFIDGTKTLGGNERITYINCIGKITADAANGLATHINCFWNAGDLDLSIPKRVLGGRVAAGNRTTDNIGGNGLCVGPTGTAQLVGASGAGGTIQSAGAAVIPLNPAGNCTGIVLAKPVSATATVDGCTIKLINLTSFTVTMAAAGTSFVADGTSCVVPALREMDFTYSTVSNLWYHT